MTASGLAAPNVEIRGCVAAATTWHILTGEYPPQPGGVSAYTRLVARALADAGDRVEVWAPPCAAEGGDVDPGVSVRRLPDHFGRGSFRLLDQELARVPGPRRLLVQYVPHAFGWKAANVPFCWWLRSRRADSVWIMFHEVAYPVGLQYSARENALGAVTRWMASIAGRTAERIFVSIPAWRPILESLTGTRAPIIWLPVPSTIPTVDDPTGSARLRTLIAQGRPLVGHLGTYGRLIRPTLEDAVTRLMAATNCCVLLLGRHGDVVRQEMLGRHSDLSDRLVAPGPLSDADLSRHVAACDVMLQPYPDGISTRRTSAMVALSHGRPLVTTTGWLSEPFWSECGAVVLGKDDARELATITANLIGSRSRLADLSARARTLYAERFALSHTIDGLREDVVDALPGGRR